MIQCAVRLPALGFAQPSAFHAPSPPAAVTGRAFRYLEARDHGIGGQAPALSPFCSGAWPSAKSAVCPVCGPEARPLRRLQEWQRLIHTRPARVHPPDVHTARCRRIDVGCVRARAMRCWVRRSEQDPEGEPKASAASSRSSVARVTGNRNGPGCRAARCRASDRAST